MTTTTTKDEAARAEFAARKEREKAKAVQKYGADALLPAGRPDLDITDYAINELVGLVRYGEMIQARGQMMLDLMDGLPRATREAIRLARNVGGEVSLVAEDMGVALIKVRRALKDKGLALGAGEGQ